MSTKEDEIKQNYIWKSY